VVLQAKFYGLDYVEVETASFNWGDDVTLHVYFLGKAPKNLKGKESMANVRIDGGRRVPSLAVTGLAMKRAKKPWQDDYLEVKVRTSAPGDFSTYTLRLVAVDDDGHPTNQPYPGFDPRYAQVQFSFKAGCASELDCHSESVCWPEPGRFAPPDLNYLAKDYASFRRLILDRLALTMPGWQERHVPDIGITLVELLAYAGDHLSYYQDAVATEAYLDTARQRISVRRHARLIDYHLHEGCNPRAWLTLKIESDVKELSALDPEKIYFVTDFRPRLLETGKIISEDDDEFKRTPANQYEVFEPLLLPRYEFTPGDIYDWPALIAALCGPAPLDQYLWGQLPEALQQALIEYGEAVEEARAGEQEPPPLPDSLKAALLSELNRMLQDTSLANPQVCDLSPLEANEPELLALIRANPQGKLLVSLNRRLLELAYPALIRPSRLIELFKDHSQINFYTWGDAECCLPRGATTASLTGRLAGANLPEISRPEVERPAGGKKRRGKDEVEEDVEPVANDRKTPPESPTLYLRPGDILIFEEVLGPKSGYPADADPAHRHAVRLTEVSQSIDPLNGRPVVEITWAEADKLPFPLCLSAVGGAKCGLISDISVARGNVLLVDHGRRVGPEDLGRVELKRQPHRCLGEGVAAELPPEPARYRPRLDYGPLVFRQPLPDQAAASALLKQEPRQARPALWLTGWPEITTSPPPTMSRTVWQPQPDLMASRAGDSHVVVEVDNEDRAQLRFGDGELGRRPEVGHHFSAIYRVGGGPAGHVGAEMISLLVTRSGYNPLSGVNLTVRNPFPAQGGIAPEPLADVKQYAAFAFKQKLQRAITAADYAELAQQYPGVQRAAARLRWTGSWYEALVVIDPSGQAEAGPELLAAIEAYLYPFRRIGHDVVVRRAHNVPLDIKMTVCVRPGYLKGQVKAALLELFSSGRRADGRPGYFHPDNLSFDHDITVSTLVGLAQGVAGVESVTVTRLDRYGELPGDALTSGILSMGPLEVPRLDNDPNFPENGKLEFEMKGGR
jgi:predicted phage baseplate assembly protein